MHTDYYIDILKNAEAISCTMKKENIKEQKELKLLRALACAGAIRSGATFTVELKDPDDMLVKKQNSILQTLSLEKSKPVEKTPWVYILHEEKKIAIPGSELQNVMHGEYDKLIVPKLPMDTDMAAQATANPEDEDSTSQMTDDMNSPEMPKMQETQAELSMPSMSEKQDEIPAQDEEVESNSILSEIPRKQAAQGISMEPEVKESEDSTPVKAEPIVAVASEDDIDTFGVQLTDMPTEDHDEQPQVSPIKVDPDHINFNDVEEQPEEEVEVPEDPGELLHSDETEEGENKEVEEQKIPDSGKRQLVFGRYPSFPADKTGVKMESSFLCNVHHLAVIVNGRRGVIDFTIYPLEVQENAMITNIFVTAVAGNSIRAGISKGQSAAITMEFGGIAFMIRGSFKNQKFESQVNLLNAPDAEVKENVIRHERKDRTSTTYAMIEEADKNLYIFPGQFLDNGPNGLSAAAMAVDKGDGNVIVLCPTQEGNFIINEGGIERSLEIYWMGNEFCTEFV